VTELFSTRDLSVHYGGTVAVDRVSLSVDEGSLMGLIGPNGAGKTSLIDAVTGFAAARGTVTFDGSEIHGLAPHRRALAGLGRSFQTIELFDDLTVEENVALGRRHTSRRRHRSTLHGGTALDPGPRELMETLGIARLADRPAESLSHGQRKYVGLARVLASRPKMVLLDEPAAGLDSRESEELGRTLQGLVAEGLTILLVDHDMSLVLNVCEQIHVLDFGRLICSGTSSQVVSDPKVLAAYLGSPEEVVEGAQ